ncbi:MAG: EAL domain-containing protein [Thermosynechococcaceae cyanobacterium]
MSVNYSPTIEMTLKPDLVPHLAADIIIVDDTLENLKLLSKMLSEQGYRVRKAMTGEMALKAIEVLPPDLLLLDIMMPTLSGFDVCKALKSNPKTADIPVIFLSALDDAADKVNAFNAGGADYISKPFHLEEVLLRIHHQLALRAAQQQIFDLNAKLEAQVQKKTQQLSIAQYRLLETQLYDDLTGLTNRSTFIERVAQSLEAIQHDPNKAFAILMLDCDRFKVINYSLGHPVGDELLKELAKSLQGLMGQNDVFARIGGDEFAILLNSVADIDEAIGVANAILTLLKQPFRAQNHEIFVNVSIGLVLSNPVYERPEQLLRDANIALHRAKTLGRKQCQVFDQAKHQTAHRLLEIETDLHRAISQQEFVVYYQPIVDLTTGAIAGLEALVRWDHPQRGLVPPGDFLPVAEETGLICPIGHAVMQQACHQLHQWQQAGFPDLMLYINLSAQEFNQPHLIEDIDLILAETQISPRSIKLEITESSMIQNLQVTMPILNQLRERGIQLSIDDFGTGYSSLGQLQNLPVNTLKIDRAFTKQLDGTPETLGLVPVILSIAQVMKMDAVAEGIETEAQLAQLRALKCRFGQGFFFAKPQNAQRVTELLAQHDQW